MLANITPLRGNCGRRCSSACCRGGDNDGMELLPGEYNCDEMPFGIVRNNIFVCDGHCERNNRPYACMIFPLFPAVRVAGSQISVTAIPDIRAKDICPIDPLTIKREFYSYVRRSAYILCESEELKQYLIRKTEEMDSILQLNIMLKTK